MSRGLGPIQFQALDLLAGAERGLTVAQLAQRLGLTQRRARTVVTTLVVREQVLTFGGGRARRVWDPGRAAEWQMREYHALVERQRRLWLTAPTCPACGQTIPPPRSGIRTASREESGPGPVESNGSADHDEPRSGGVAPTQGEARSGPADSPVSHSPRS